MPPPSYLDGEETGEVLAIVANDKGMSKERDKLKEGSLDGLGKNKLSGSGDHDICRGVGGRGGVTRPHEGERGGVTHPHEGGRRGVTRPHEGGEG